MIEQYIDAIIFDMDGVTLDSERLYAMAESKLFKEYGVDIPDEDWKLFRGASEEHFYTLSMSRYNISENRQVFMNKGREYLLEVFSKHLDFMPGFLSLMNRIRHIKRGLVTATNEDMYNWLNDKINVSSHFDSVIFGGMTTHNKPHPEPYLTMMKKLNVQPGKCVVIEDSVHGIASGLSAGAKVIALSGSVEPEELAKANTVVHHLNEINEPLLISLFD